MKPHSIIGLFLAGMLLTGCASTTRTVDVTMTVFVDLTDTMKLYPTATAITAPLGLTDNPYQSISIEITAITDKDFGPTAVFTLPDDNKWSGNSTIRTAMIRHFIAQVQACLDTLKRSSTFHHSIIYRPVAIACNHLATATATHTYLLLYSDLEEHSSVNFYTAQTIDSLRNNPQDVEKRFEKDTPLSNLTGLQVWLLYNPTSYQDNNRYRVLAGFYQHLLAEHGAVVHIGTNFLPQ